MGNAYDFRTIQGTGDWTDFCDNECDLLEDDERCIHEIEHEEGDSDISDF